MLNFVEQKKNSNKVEYEIIVYIFCTDYLNKTVKNITLNINRNTPQLMWHGLRYIFVYVRKNVIFPFMRDFSSLLKARVF